MPCKVTKLQEHTLHFLAILTHSVRASSSCLERKPLPSDLQPETNLCLSFLRLPRGLLVLLLVQLHRAAAVFCLAHGEHLGVLSCVSGRQAVLCNLMAGILGHVV